MMCRKFLLKTFVIATALCFSNIAAALENKELPTGKLEVVVVNNRDRH